VTAAATSVADGRTVTTTYRCDEFTMVTRGGKSHLVTEISVSDRALPPAAERLLGREFPSVDEAREALEAAVGGGAPR
jgi:hypothetical protein